MSVAVLEKPKTKTKNAFALSNVAHTYAEIERLEKEIEEKEIEKELALSELDFATGDVVTLSELKTSIEHRFGFI
jgi:hypothetical protein